MSTNVFPSLIGLEYPVPRSALWNTIVEESVSGKRVGIGLWSYPRWAWEVSFSYLPFDGDQDFQELAGFFNEVYGRMDTFLYTDADDNTASSQPIGLANGVLEEFQLVRTMGGFTEPMLAPNVVSEVKIGSSVQASSTYSVSRWGDDSPGVVTFSSAPSSSGIVTASFTYYFPVRFDDDAMSFENFLKQIYLGRSIKFSSEK